MFKLLIKPLSVNKAWQGKRFKSREYHAYERSLLLLLPAYTVPFGNLSVHFRFGFSNINADIDNPVKPLLDCLQKAYEFNDSRVVRLKVEKVKVKKGEEFIEWEIV